jgi:hypothetical protein
MEENTLIISSSNTLIQNQKTSILCWLVTAILLSFLSLTHLLVIFSFLLGWQVSAVGAPSALIISLIGGYMLGQKEGLQKWQRIFPLLISLSVVGIALLLAAAFFDLSWDGLWYHQTAVYQMSHGWNPLYDPLHNFAPHLQDWLRFYAKGPWYIDLALFKMTNNIEMAKAAPWIALAATFLAVFAVSIDFRMSLSKATVMAALIVFNPVIICELATYLVDGLMVSFLLIFITAMVRWFRRPTLLTILIAVMSAVLCINSKFTGLVYLCFFIAMGGIYILIKERKLIWKYLIIQSAAIIAGILIFGWNPYVSNTICRGNPFYPMLGSSVYPSLSAMGQDPIELYETPHNMMGKDRFTRFAYAIFGRPGAQPYFPGENAILMRPFDIGWKDFGIFYFHDVRISGFGPLFSGTLILSFFLLIFILFHKDTPRLFIILLYATIVLSLLISTHTWWARYGPQLWLLPIVSIIAGFTFTNSRVVYWSARILAVILLFNAISIAVVHFRWEAEATRTTNEQLSLLRQSGDVGINFGYFREPFSERLRRAGITFHIIRHMQCDKPIELMSVSPGYPGAVRACIKKHQNP